MTIELLTKYERMIKEIRSLDRRRRARDYLLKISPEDLEHQMADYISRSQNKYCFKPEDEFLILVEGFNRKGTIHSPVSIDEICDRVRKTRRKLMGYET